MSMHIRSDSVGLLLQPAQHRLAYAGTNEISIDALASQCTSSGLRCAAVFRLEHVTLNGINS